MKTSRSFRPVVMALETRELLTVYPMSVAAFAMPNT